MTKQIKIGHRVLITLSWSKSFGAYGIDERKLNVTITQLPPNMIYDDNNVIKTIYPT